MKRWLILAALVVAISATATVAVQYLPTGDPATEGPEFPVAPKVIGPAPQVVVEPDLTYTFDVKPQYETFRRDWVIKNTGEADLVLQKARSTCSCTVAEFDKKPGDPEGAELRIKPGGSATLHLTFETRSFEGAYEKSATVATNDPRHPELTFAAKGTIHPALVLWPPARSIDFSTVSNDADHSARLSVGSADRPGFKVTKVTTSKPDVLVASFEPLPEDDHDRTPLKLKSGGYRIKVDLKPGLPLGSFREELVIATDHPKEPELKLPIHGKVVGPVNVIPEQLRMVNVSGSDGGRRDLTIFVTGLRETRIEVASLPKPLQAEVTPVAPDTKGKYRLSVEVPPGTPPSEIEGEIVLKTDHPKAKEVKVPVFIIVRQK